MTAANRKENSTLEHGDLARTLRRVFVGDVRLYFGREQCRSEVLKKFNGSKVASNATAFENSALGNTLFGFTSDTVLAQTANGETVLITATGTKESSKTIAEILQEATSAIPEFPQVSAGTRKYMYSRVKMLSQYLPTAVIVGYISGVIGLLNEAGIKFKLIDKMAFKRGSVGKMDTFVFKDAVLAIDVKNQADSLLVNGLKEIDTSEYEIKEFGPAGMAWVDHIADRLGTPGHAKGLINFQASFIDPVTREILEEDKLPTMLSGVLIYCNKLLEGNVFTAPNDMRNYRIRGPELVSAILYKAIHTEMQRVRMTRESATPQRLSIAQGEVIRQLVGASNVEEVKRLNPLDEVEIRGKVSWTGAAGGLGDGRTVTREMRAFHKSMHGLTGYYSPDSGEIGVKRALTVNTKVVNVRGKIEEAPEVKDAADFLATGELMVPFCATHTDPPRIGMQSKQGTHTMPIQRHTPALIGTGCERSISSSIGNTFAFKAKTSGKVRSIDLKNECAILDYDDGTVGSIDLGARSIKNSGGGFFITSRLQPIKSFKPGMKFAKNHVLAVDPSYFDESENGITYKAGVLVRTALVPSDQVYEDSLMVSRNLIGNTAALVTMVRPVSLNAKANLQSTAKIGDKVKPGTAIAVFENVTDDADISDLLQRVGKEFDDAIADLTRNQALAKYDGTIVEIRVYYNVAIEKLSPSLQKFIKSQEKIAAEKNAAVKDVDPIERPRVVGPQFINRDKVNGEGVDGVLIQFMVQIRDEAAPGDKLVSSSPLKGIISRVFEEGEVPFSEDGKDVDFVMSPLSTISRMTSDAFMALWANAAIYGLRERILEVAKG